MTDGQRNVIDSLKSYVAEYEALYVAKSDLFKLKYTEKPSKPAKPIRKELSIKAKVLTPLKTDKFIKSVIFCITEVALFIFLIICFANGSNEELGFWGTVLIMLGVPASIALMIFVGIKIKKTDGISPYIRAKKENELKIRYNQKHAKEIKEALEAEDVRYNNALTEYEEKEKEYNIAAEKYEQEIGKPMKELKIRIEQSEKRVNDFEEFFKDGLGKCIAKCRNVPRAISLKNKYFVRSDDLRELLKYYFDKNCFDDNAQMDDLLNDISTKIVFGTDDERLSIILDKMKDYHLSMVEYLNEEERERLAKWEAGKEQRSADTRCRSCKYYESCANKGKIDCGHYTPKGLF